MGSCLNRRLVGWVPGVGSPQVLISPDENTDSGEPRRSPFAFALSKGGAHLSWPSDISPGAWRLSAAAGPYASDGRVRGGARFESHASDEAEGVLPGAWHELSRPVTSTVAAVARRHGRGTPRAPIQSLRLVGFLHPGW